MVAAAATKARAKWGFTGTLGLIAYAARFRFLRQRMRLSARHCKGLSRCPTAAATALPSRHLRNPCNTGNEQRISSERRPVAAAARRRQGGSAVKPSNATAERTKARPATPQQDWLTTSIKQCRSIEQLWHLLQQQTCNLHTSHLCVVLDQAAKLIPDPQHSTTPEQEDCLWHLASQVQQMLSQQGSTSSSQLADIAWGSVRLALHSRSGDLRGCLAQAAAQQQQQQRQQPRVSHLSAQDTAKLFWALAVMSQDCFDQRGVLQRLLAHSHSLNATIHIHGRQGAQDLSAAAQDSAAAHDSAASASAQDSAAAAAAAAAAAHKLLATAVWALAKLRHLQGTRRAANEQLVQEVLECVTIMQPACTAQDLTTLVRHVSNRLPCFRPANFAAAGGPDQDTTFDRLSGLNLTQQRQLTRCIMRCRTDAQFMQLVHERGNSFNAFHLSAALTQAAVFIPDPSMATAEQEDCLCQLLSLVELRLGKYASQPDQVSGRNLASIAVGVAKMQRHGPEAPEAVSLLVQLASAQLPRFSAQDTARLIWALACTGCEDRRELQELLAHARSLDLGGEDAGTLLWALAQLQGVARDEALVRQVLSYVPQQLPSYTTPHIATVACAIAALQIRHLDVTYPTLQLLLDEVTSRELVLPPAHPTQPPCDLHSLSRLLSAMAQLDYRHDPWFVQDVVDRLLMADCYGPNMPTCETVCRALGALAVLQPCMMRAWWDWDSDDEDDEARPPAAKPHHPQELVYLLVSLVDRQLGLLRKEDFAQVQPYLETMEREGHLDAELQQGSGYRHMRRYCSEAAEEQAEERRARPERFAEQVLRAVRQVPGCGDAERLMDGGELSTDVGFTMQDGTKVAMALEFPSSALQGTALPGGLHPEASRSPGFRVWKLSSRGYKVVLVLEAAWQRAKFRPHDAYRLLKKAGVILQEGVVFAEWSE